MQKTLKVTLLVVPVMALVSLFHAVAVAATIKPKVVANKPVNTVKNATTTKETKTASKSSSAKSAPAAPPSYYSNKSSLQQNKVVMKADQIEKEEDAREPKVGVAIQISRSTSLYDHKDGSRGDSMDYLVAPKMQLGFGSVQAKIIYSQNLRDDTGHTYDGTAAASDWGDIAVTFAKNPYKWMWSYPYMITLTPFASGVIPASQNSLKRDELKTAISGGVSFGIVPDGVAPQSDGMWSFAIGVTAGRSIHAYETNINGAVLNRYSSNQTLNVSYSYKDFSFGVEFINKSRWTYQGNARSSYEHSEELGYGINDNFSIAIGHSNGGSSLKANGVDSNLELVNENDSTAYATLGISF